MIKLDYEEILDYFEKLGIKSDLNFNKGNFEVWEVPPIPKGTRIFTKSYD